MSSNGNNKVNYNNFSKTFSNSRKNMKWEEIEYFFTHYKAYIEGKNILDIGCGSGRLFGNLENFLGKNSFSYLGIDASSEMIKEAQKNYQADFQVLDMGDINTLGEKFDALFFIASFHHLETLEQRREVLKKLKYITSPNTYIFMTHWALESTFNLERYKNSLMPNSQNQFFSKDFMIKIGNFERFYHSFSLPELEYLFQQTGYEVVENRLFDGERNIISIIKTK